MWKMIALALVITCTYCPKLIFMMYAPSDAHYI